MASVLRISQCLVLLVFAPIGIFSVPVKQQLNPDSAAQPKTLHILAIGISKYQHYRAVDVPAFANKDAKDFVASLEGVARGSFGSVRTRLLIDEEATRAAIGLAVEDLWAVVQPQDTLVFFYSGHGMTRTLGLKREEQFYLIPSNFDPALGKQELNAKGIANVLLHSWLLRIRAQRQFLVINSSKSGRGFEGFVSRAEEDNKFLGTAERRDLAVLFNNAGSYELERLENGLLPYVLIEAFKGGVATANGVVTAKGLIDYVEQNARDVLRRSGNTATRRFLSRLINSGLPSSYRTGEDFPLGSNPTEIQARFSKKEFHKRSALLQSEVALRVYRTASAPSQALPIDPTIRMVPATSQDQFIMPAECAAMSEIRPATGTLRKGRDRALLFATDFYDAWTPLNNPVLDATALADLLNIQFGFETEVVKNPTKECVSQFIAKYRFKKYKQDEQLLIFFAGHGSYRSNYDGFLITRNSKANNLDPGGDSFISHSLISRFIGGIPCEHIFLILDSCFGGSMASAKSRSDEERNSPPTEVVVDSGTDTAVPEPEHELIRALMKFKTRRFLTSGGNEYVPDGTPGNHSPFVNKLLSAFETNSRNRSFITVSEIIPKVTFADPYQPIVLYDEWPSNESQSDFFFFLVSQLTELRH